MKALRLAPLYLLTGCVIPSALGTSDTDSGETGSSTTLPDTSLPSTSGGPTASTTSSGESSGSTSTTSPPGSSGVPADCEDVVPAENPEEWNCSTEDDDTCPECHKCAFDWDGTSPDPTESGTICVPVDPDPVGPFEDCTLGDMNGYDNCDADSLCWNGYCIPRCGVDLPCADGTFCLGNSSDEIGCIPNCDPLAPDCPADNEICLHLGDEFACLPDPGVAPGYGEECFGGCGEGLTCVNSDVFGPGCAAQGCCTEVCEIDGANTCTDGTHECLPGCTFGEFGDGFDHLGACGILPDPLPNTCKPENADPNVPWCSTANDGDCGADGLFGGGTDCVETCFCTLPCGGVDDCDVPATGTAELLCEPLFAGKDDTCLLSCADGETCPDAMYCSEVLYPGRCMWFYELEPGCL